MRLRLGPDRNGVPFVQGTGQITLYGAAIDYWYTAYHDNIRLIVASDAVSESVAVKP